MAPWAPQCSKKQHMFLEYGVPLSVLSCYRGCLLHLLAIYVTPNSQNAAGAGLPEV